VFKGRCAALIQSTDKGGAVKINVMSEDLKTGEYRLQII
jgi:hypothetical protein